MKLNDIEFTDAEINALYECACEYENAIKTLKEKGVKYPERAVKSMMKEINDNLPVEELSVVVENDTESFSVFFNVGNTAGYSLEEIQEAFENKDQQFLIENSFYNGILSKIKTLKTVGHKIHNLVVTSRGGVPHAEFVSTDKNSNKKRHVIHGNSSTDVNLGKAKDTDPDAQDSGI